MIQKITYESILELIDASKILTRMVISEEFRAIKKIENTHVKGNILFQLIYDATSSYEEFAKIFNDWKKLDEQHSLEKMYSMFGLVEREEENV